MSLYDLALFVPCCSLCSYAYKLVLGSHICLKIRMYSLLGQWSADADAQYEFARRLEGKIRRCGTERITPRRLFPQGSSPWFGDLFMMQVYTQEFHFVVCHGSSLDTALTAIMKNADLTLENYHFAIRSRWWNQRTK